MDQKHGQWFGGKARANDAANKDSTPSAKSPATPVQSATLDSARAGAGAEPPREYSPEEQQLLGELMRTLGGRCDVMMRAAAPETRQSDAPMVVERLRALDGAAIRQPPDAVQRALAVTRNPESSAKDLAAIFERDPALAEGLLQMANSSYYHRGNEPCIAIPEAIQRVGVRGVEAIVTTHMVEGLLCRPGNAYANLLTQVWAHMMRTAPIARSLAPAFKADPETALTVGLLHDIGRLMIFDYLSQLRLQHRREIKVPEQFLFNLLNRLHEPLGGIAALRWNLGVNVARSIGYHHHAPPPEQPDLLSELLCVAEQADHAIRVNKRIDVWQMWRNCELTADAQVAIELLATIPNLALSGPEGSKAAAAKAA